MPECKLVLAKEKPVKGLRSAQVDFETHAVLSDLSAQTGLSICKLIGKCVAFAVDHMDIVDNEEVR